MNYQYIGKSTPVNNSRAKASGLLRYAGDMQLPNMLHMKLVLSPVAHGIVKAIDASAALATPGVAAVLSFENTPDTKYNRGRVRAREDAVDQETLFSRHVRFVGDRVAAVLADTPEIAAAAAEKIKLEIEELPAVFTVEDAMKEDAPQLHEGGNTVTLPESGFGGKYTDAQGEEFIHRSQTQRITHIAMETHCAVADYNPGTDRMTVWSPTQATFGVRSSIATLFHMPMSHIRAIKTPMGGSFGCKQEMILEPLAAAGAKMTCRPVKLQLDRRETILCTVLRHPIKSEIRAKFDENHVLKALDLTAQLDAGGYQGISPDYMGSMFKKLAWVYGVEDVEYHATSTCTNTPVSGSYRGWGGPETAFIMENMMNAAAQKFRCDPLELRLKNILPPDAISKIGNFPLGDVRLEDVLRLGSERFRWSERRAAAQAQDRSSRYLKGVGLAVSTHTSGYYPRRLDWCTVTAKFEEDGSASFNCNIHDHGCGTVAALKNIAAEELSILPDTIDFPEGDTEYNGLDNGCYTSRTIYVTGRAVQETAQKLKALLLENAAKLMDCDACELSCQDGMVFVTADPSRRKTYSDVVYYSADQYGGSGAIFVSHTYQPSSNPGPAAAHFAEVEVDTLTGLCRLTAYTAAHDVGKAINPELCRGQVGSALQQGMGLVFCEQVKIDPKTGQPLNATLQRYHVARACDFPHIETVLVENGSPEGPYGAKSIGESCFVPVAPALLAAVNDALQTDLTTLPLTPEKIIRAVQEKRKEASL